MNPLFLLFGLLGASATARGFAKSGETTFSGGRGLTNNKVTDDDPLDPIDEPPVEEPVVTVSDPVVVTDPAPTDEPEDTEETPSDDPAPEPTAEDPAPEDPTPETPVVSNPTPDAPDQTDTGGTGGTTDPTVISDGTTEVMAGRVATLQASGDVIDVRIVSGVDHGTVTVNPDNTFALVMTQSDFVGSQSFTYEATHSDGSTSLHEVGLDVTPGLQGAGWGSGESHYMLATDENDKVIVEAGENHTKVYLSGSNEALSLSEIATMEGMSASEITGEWLASHGGYGQSEGMALDAEAGMLLWNAVTPENEATSNWMLFERGYAYDFGDRWDIKQTGEGELNPLYFGAWGEGERPEIQSMIQMIWHNDNLVFQDIHLSARLRVIDVDNVILDNIKSTLDQVDFQNGEGITIRNSEILDHYQQEPSGTDGIWSGHEAREQGIYIGGIDGLLLEGNLFDHNGWEDGYDPDGSLDSGQPPSMWSHNIYIDNNNLDVTIRDTISMRASSYAMGVRSGGFLEDNVVMDSNAAISFDGGGWREDGYIGNYSLLLDNLVTSGGHRESIINHGAMTYGLHDKGQLTTMVDNIVTHLADPNNAQEQAEKDTHHSGFETENAYYNDTIVYNWGDYTDDRNVDGLDTNALNQTTIQLFTAQLLGDPNATIADLADYLRNQADGAFDNVVDADLIIRFFQEGFGIAPDIREIDATLRFVPNDLGDGIRWDNRLNWDTEDLPGLYGTDSADLGGNHVVFGTNATIDTLDMGPGGALSVYGGRLTLNGGLTGDDSGSLHLEGAGQVWTNGSDAVDLDVTVDGGRFANTGVMQNTSLSATDGQAILATGGAEFDLAAGETLALESDAKVGFDGEDGDLAILDMHEGATLAFSAQDGDLGSIEEFRSGAMGDTPDVQSGIDLGNGTLQIDLSGLNAEAGTAFTLMDVDEIVGIFDDAIVGGLGARDATILVDYESDSVTLELNAGSGGVSVQTVGTQTDVTEGSESLWDALTAGQGTTSETLAAIVAGDEDDITDPLIAA